MRNISPLLLLLAGASVAPSDGAKKGAGAVRADYIVYEAQEGDRLSDLAERHFLNPEDGRKARALNGLMQDELVPGSRLRLETAWLRRTALAAEVVAFRGDVRIRRGSVEIMPQRGSTIAEGDAILTGALGFVTLRLSDGSELAIPTNSQVRFLRLRGYSLGNLVDRRLLIEQGSIDSRVTPMRRPGSRYEVTTPVSVAAVRGTEFRVTFTPGSPRSTTEVLEGRVGVLAVGPSAPNERAVPAGFGVVATAAGVGLPEALLPAPVIEGPGPLVQQRRLVIGLRRDGAVAAWRLELATDPAFTDRVAELVSEDGEYALGDLPPGIYHARLRALSRSGLAGRAATFTLRTSSHLALAAGADAPGDGPTEPPAPAEGDPPVIPGDRPGGLAGLVADFAAAAEEIPPMIAELAGTEEGDAADEEWLAAVLSASPSGGGGATVSAGGGGIEGLAGSLSKPGSSHGSWSMAAPGVPSGAGLGGWGSQGAPRFAPSTSFSGGGLVPGLLPPVEPPSPSLPILPSPALPLEELPPLPGPSTAVAPPSGLAAIPEPSTWMMLIVGFGLVGLAARSRARGRRRVAGARG